MKSLAISRLSAYFAGLFFVEIATKKDKCNHLATFLLHARYKKTLKKRGRLCIM